MTKIPLGIPRREVPKGKYPIYLQKADEFLAEAQDAFLKERFNAQNFEVKCQTLCTSRIGEKPNYE